jgi:HSP20 family protein
MNNLTIKRRALRPAWAKDVERFFDEGFFWNADNPISSFFGPTKLPATNVTDNENESVVEMAVPGVKKNNIEISINEDILTVSGNEKTETKQDDGKTIRKEFNYNSFSRSFVLPEDADADKIESSFENGVLKITIPKTGKPKVKKVIEIK